MFSDTSCSSLQRHVCKDAEVRCCKGLLRERFILKDGGIAAVKEDPTNLVLVIENAMLKVES